MKFKALSMEARMSQCLCGTWDHAWTEQALTCMRRWHNRHLYDRPLRVPRLADEQGETIPTIWDGRRFLPA